MHLLRGGRGGRIYGIDFEVTRQEVVVEDTKKEPVKVPGAEELDGLADQVLEIIEEKIKISEAKALLKAADYDLSRIEQAYSLACKQEEIHNLMGWMTAALQHGYEDRPIHKVRGQAAEETVEFDAFMDELREKKAVNS